jgi:hypothetical protein
MSDYSTPKENWAAGETPVPSDLNRMEKNARANHEDLIAGDLAEASTRGAADTALVASIDALESIFTAGLAGTYDHVTIGAGGSWTIPAGLYMMSNSGADLVRLTINGGLAGFNGASPLGGLILSDGVNFKALSSATGDRVIYYRKLM